MKNKLTALFLEFFRSEQASGVVLILCTSLALGLANSPLGDRFLSLWRWEIGFHLGSFSFEGDLEHWINDGLMAVFFLLIGLEIERELYVGELADRKSALLPVAAAFGGMLAPALIHVALNWGTDTQAGFGIPMATDIAFALGILSLAGSRVPPSLKVFLTALAIIDDLGAILVIALFYSRDFSALYLALAGAVLLVLLLLNRLGVRHLAAYLALGALMWFLIFESGIHASISGVLLAFVIPFHDGSESSPSHRLEHFLQRPVAFGIMPLFALANTGIVLAGLSLAKFVTRNTLGIFFGMLAGKPAGIVLFSLLATKLGWATSPDGLSHSHLIGAGFLGGIGFTMAIFMTFLAFGDTEIARYSKLAVLLGSLLSGLVGYAILRTRPLVSAPGT
ncbi:MAG: Na+/H+ antiporter NhaA [Bacteroidota bacterium]